MPYIRGEKMLNKNGEADWRNVIRGLDSRTHGLTHEVYYTMLGPSTMRVLIGVVAY